MKGLARGSRVDVLLEELWNAGGTDLLLTVGMPPQIRVHGALHAVSGTPALRHDDTDELLTELFTPAQADAWCNSFELDFSFSWRDHARIRGTAFSQRGDSTISLRMIPRTIPTMAAMNSSTTRTGAGSTSPTTIRKLRPPAR